MDHVYVTTAVGDSGLLGVAVSSSAAAARDTHRRIVAYQVEAHHAVRFTSHGDADKRLATGSVITRVPAKDGGVQIVTRRCDVWTGARIDRELQEAAK